MSGARKTAIVTGGAGFIGSHMLDLLLDRDYGVRLLDIAAEAGADVGVCATRTAACSP